MGESTRGGQGSNRLGQVGTLKGTGTVNKSNKGKAMAVSQKEQKRTDKMPRPGAESLASMAVEDVDGELRRMGIDPDRPLPDAIYQLIYKDVMQSDAKVSDLAKLEKAIE